MSKKQTQISKKTDLRIDHFHRMKNDKLLSSSPIHQIRKRSRNKIPRKLNPYRQQYANVVTTDRESIPFSSQGHVLLTSE